MLLNQRNILIIKSCGSVQFIPYLFLVPFLFQFCPIHCSLVRLSFRFQLLCLLWFPVCRIFKQNFKYFNYLTQLLSLNWQMHTAHQLLWDSMQLPTKFPQNYSMQIHFGTVSSAYLLWFWQMCVQVKLRANFIPVGEASFLDSWHMAGQIWAVLVDVVSQWEVHFFWDESELWQDSERDDIQL